MRRFLVISLLLLLMLQLGCGCAAEKSDDRLLTRPFTATIEGTRGEMAFSARISLSADGERSIRYTAPETLAGLTATATADGVRVVQGDLSAAVPSAGGLFLPLDLLTSPAALAARQERNGEVSLTYTDGTEVILSPDGTPRAVIRPDLTFTVSDLRPVS